MSSNAGILGVDRDVAYTATKGAVRLLTKSVAVHCARSGLKIRCNSIHPGAIRTPIFNAVVQDAPDPEAALSVFKNMSPFGRMGEPGEIAAFAAYLASDESAFATGAEFVIDGGTTSGLPPV